MAADFEPPADPHGHPPRSAWTDIRHALADADAQPGGEAQPLDEDTVWDWSLVLRAARIPHRTQRLRGGGWLLLVPGAHLRAAAGEIAAFERENPPSEVAPAPPPSAMGSEALDVLLVMLVALFQYVAVSNPLPSLGIYPEDWLDMGTMDSTLVLRGQWWRAVTALTLHADPAHFLANAVLGGVLVACLCRAAGTGAAWLLFVASGTAGNLLNAWARGPGHLSIGASTAVFGAVAALGAVTMVRQGGFDPRRAAAPVVAALAILGMWGTGGQRTDLGAHLFGFLAGLPMGLATGRWIMRHGLPSRPLSATLGLCALAILAASWWLALGWGGFVPA